MSQPSPAVQAKLREVARLLRDVKHLHPAEQAELARLVDELADALKAVALPQSEAQHLSESTAHLVDALHRKHEEGVLEGARKRLEEAAVRIEAQAPVASGVVRRLIDTLANLGI